MADGSATSERIASLSNEQKIIFGLLVFFAICVVGLGILQIRTTMYAPFALTSAVPNDIKSEVTGVDALRYRDTDHDGLTDFDELYVYGTSPYLYDTFSYGFSDKEVIAKGLPLCPKGQDCSTVAENNTTVLNASATTTVLGGETAALGAAPEDLSVLLSDPKKIRALLLQSGVQADVLTKVSDKDLMTLVTQLINSSSTLANIQALNTAAQAGTNSPK